MIYWQLTKVKNENTDLSAPSKLNEIKCDVVKAV